jgi:hypothetical protein
MKKIMSILVGFGLLLGTAYLFAQEKQEPTKAEKGKSTKKNTKGKNQKSKAEEPKAQKRKS